MRRPLTLTALLVALAVAAPAAGAAKYVVRGRGNGHGIGTVGSALRIASARGAVRLGGRSLNGVPNGAYRGSIELRPSSGGGLLAIDVAGLDDYVKGVVPGEVPASWPAEALKAQAVA